MANHAVMRDPTLNALLMRGSFHVERHVADAMSAAHWHNHVEINLLLDGHMTYLFNGKQAHVAAGRLAMFWAAIPHRTIDVSAGTSLICIYLPLMDFLVLPVSRTARQAVMGGTFIADPAPDPADMAASERWVAAWESGNEMQRHLAADEARLRIRRLLIDWSGGGTAQTAPDAAASSPVRHTERLSELINAHFSEQLSVARLARMSGISPSTASKSFRQVLGLPINEYIIRYRLARAMQRLADTDDPILRITFDSGFGSTSQFYELFGRRVGMTPRQFRTKNRATAR